MGRDVHFRIIPQHSKMECLAESMSVDPSKHRQELLERLDILRNNGSFCDVTIAVKDKEFKAHRAVLAAASPFFLTLLTSDMKESNEQLIKAELEETTETVMEDALKYLYTGNVTVVEERAHNLIATANFLLLPSLKTMAGNVLKETVTTENCVFNYYFAEKYECVELKEKCCEVIKSKFCTVMETEDFLNLDMKQVMEWMSSDDVIVNSEEDVFKGIVKWVSHNKRDRENHFLELLSQVRMASVSQDFLLNQLPKEELVISNAKIGLNFVLDAIKTKLSATDEQAIQLQRKCLETHIDGIFLCGGKKALCYFPQLEDYKWYWMEDTLFEHENPTPAWHNSKVYIFDSKVHKVGESQVVECYAGNNTWAAFQRADAPTIFNGYTILNDELYGICFPNSFEKLQIFRYEYEEYYYWKREESSPFVQEDPCAVNDEQFLYIIGGRNTRKTMRFDSGCSKWEELAAVKEIRYYAFGAAMNGKIYVAGGLGHRGVVLSSCEVYNSGTNEWQLMPTLNIPRYNANMVCLKGDLYVLGGTTTLKRSRVRALTVEMLDSDSDKWKEISQIPVENFESQEEIKKGKGFHACVARLCKKLISTLEPLDLE